MAHPSRSILIFAILGLALGFFLAAVLPGLAQTDGEPVPASITFPVAELGGCTSKAECKSYCDDTAHMDACVTFAEKHGLMNKSEVQRAKKFAGQLKSGGGPGGCRSPRECDSFCSNLNNLETCLQFAESQGIQDEHFEEGRKIQTYLKSGGRMPGGCFSKESCEAYCGNFEHATECFEFAQKAGLAGPNDERGPKSPEQMRRIMELTQRGETPGGCKSKEQCDNYCGDQSHFEECITFAEKAGFMSAAEVQQIRKTGGKGPGGCSSRESCEAFCNNPDNREECFRFGQEHGLISEADVQNAKDGMIRLRQGLEQAPSEVVACLKATLGPNIIERIQAGDLVPGPQIGEQMKGCFEKFGESHRPREAMRGLPPEVKSCIQEKLGVAIEDIESGRVEMTPEKGDLMRVCFQSVSMQNGEGFGGGPQGGPGGADFLRSAPPQLIACIESKLGAENFEKLKSGQSQPDGSFQDLVRGCFESFRPADQSGPRPEMMPGGVPPSPSQFGPSRSIGNNAGSSSPSAIPAGVLECVRRTLGDEAARLLTRGDQPTASSGEVLKRCFMEMNPPPMPSGDNFQADFDAQRRELEERMYKTEEMRRYEAERMQGLPPPNQLPPPPPPDSGTQTFDSVPPPVGSTPPPPSEPTTSAQGSFLGLIHRAFGSLLGL